MKYRLAYKTKSMFKFKNGSTAGGVNAVIVNYRAYKGLYCTYVKRDRAKEKASEEQ